VEQASCLLLKPNKYILNKFFNNHVKTQLEWIKEKGICQKITQYAFDNLGNAFDRSRPRSERSGQYIASGLGVNAR
jgi:hypothetical protein